MKKELLIQKTFTGPKEDYGYQQLKDFGHGVYQYPATQGYKENIDIRMMMK